MGKVLGRNIKEVIGLNIILILVFQIALSNSWKNDFRFHKSIPCTKCHLQQAMVTKNKQAIPKIDKMSKCRSCHKQNIKNKFNISLNFHADYSRPCSDCHSFHNASFVSARDKKFEINIENKRQLFLCSSCHNDNQNVEYLSPGHKIAAKLFHSDDKYLGSLSPSQDCLICHSHNSRYKGLANFRYLPQLDEKHDHPVGVILKKGKMKNGNRIRKNIDSRLKLFDGKIECQTCHSLSANNQYRLVISNDINKLCKGCHLFG